MRSNKKIKRLIRESIKKEIEKENAWKNICEAYRNKKIKLIKQGYEGKKLQEQSAAAADAMVRALFGGSVSSILGFGGGEGATGSAKEIVLQEFLGAVVKKIGLEDQKGLGIFVTNALEALSKELTPDEIKSMLEDNNSSCYIAAEKTASIIIDSFLEGTSEAAFNKLIDTLLKDFESMRNNRILGGLYISIREKFSSVIKEIIEEIDMSAEELKSDAASYICELSLGDLIDDIPNAGNIIGDVLSQFNKTSLSDTEDNA